MVGLCACRVDENFPGHRALWPTIGAVLIIAAGPHSWLNRRLFSNKLAVGTGLISYPLYLWHWPLLSYATILGGEYAGVWEWRLIRLFCVLIALVLAAATYFLVERPIRFGRGNKKLKTCALILLMSAVAGLGLYVFERGTPMLSNNFQEQLDALNLPPI